MSSLKDKTIFSIVSHNEYFLIIEKKEFFKKSKKFGKYFNVLTKNLFLIEDFKIIFTFEET